MVQMRRVFLGVLVVVLVAAGGCGQKTSGPVRNDAAGLVTFAGKPVDSGTILFNPKNAEFGGGVAAITNGRYNTSEPGGRGHLGGLHIVRIVAEPPEDWDGNEFRPPFPPYVVERELPAGSSTLNFEIPEGESKGRK